ncbi:MAG: ABC transporter ATP-binding protein/permease [Treponemataceae bacterium]|nr:ABC transporter ATP-binding protein/permease [Treponemataceae bacterium]
MRLIRNIMAGLERKYWACTLLSPVAAVGEVLVETIIPYFMALLIDRGIAGRDVQYVFRTGGIMVCCALVSMAFGMASARIAAVAALGFARNLRRRLFGAVQRFSFANVDRFSTASLVTRLTTDVTNTQNIYQLLIRVFFRAPFMLAAGTVMAFFINGRLALVFLVAIPVLAAAIVWIASAAYSRYGEMLAKYDRMNRTVQENLIAIRVVKAFVRGGFEREKFNGAADAVRQAQVRAERLVILLSPIMQLVIYSSLIAVFWTGGRMVVFGSMKAGELVSFLTYVTQILTSLMMMGMMFVNLVLSRASVSRICEVLDEEPDIASPAAGAARSVRDGSVDFENVSFSYQKRADNCILRNISLHIESGQMVGIIGGTGSSKSSLVQLIPRLYDVTAGVVKVGGVDVRNYALEPLRDSVAVVLQKNVLFSGTIGWNVRWGKKDASDEEVAAACRAADADGFIRSFPKQYGTELGQGGVNLSGGQKQRLCIARALLKRLKILILDDSTSAVDTATERRIRDALRAECPETTKIIIAQRISSVQDADVIFVLEDGEINGAGTHEELLASNAIYREVYESQQSMGDADLPPAQGV